MRRPGDVTVRRHAARVGLAAALATGSLAPASAALAQAQSTTPGAAATPAPTTSRGLLGGVVKGTTGTLDGALQSVTGGAVTVPSTTQTVTTVNDTVSSTVQVVSGTVEQVTAPVVSAVAGPQATLTLPGLATVDGQAVLDLVVGNAGDAACSPLAALSITGAGGVKVAGGVTQLTSIVPGASKEYVLAWPDGLSAGTYGVGATVTGCGSPQSLALQVQVGATTDPAGRSDGGGGSGSGSGSTGGGSGSSGAGSGAGSGSGSGSGAGAGSGSGSAASGSGSTGSGSGQGATGVNASTANPGTSTPGVAAATGSGGPGALARDPDRRPAAGQSDRARVPARTVSGAAASGPPAPADLVRDAQSEAVAGVTGRTARAIGRPDQSNAADTVSAVVRAIPAVLERAAPALAVLGLIGALFLLQEGVARRDPKLALAPVDAAEELDFDEPAAFLRRFARPVAPPS